LDKKKSRYLWRDFFMMSLGMVGPETFGCDLVGKEDVQC
jgi:hypothetical protein